MKNEIKVTVLHCGDVELDSSSIYREENVNILNVCSSILVQKNII